MRKGRGRPRIGTTIKAVLTDGQLARLDAVALPGEGRAGAIRRMVSIGIERALWMEAQRLREMAVAMGSAATPEWLAAQSPILARLAEIEAEEAGDE